MGQKIILVNQYGEESVNSLVTDLGANGHKIVELADPTNPQEAATKAYVDAQAGTGYLNVKTKTANYTILPTDKVILVDATGGPVTITAPTAVGIQGNAFRVKKIDTSANLVTVATTSAQTIDGESSWCLSYKKKIVEIMSDNANYQVLDFKPSGEIKNCTSNAAAIAANNSFQLHTGNSIVLTPGIWDLIGSGFFDDDGTQPNYLAWKTGWYAANGDDTSTSPAALTTATNLTLLSAADSNGRTSFFEMPAGTDIEGNVAQHLRVKVSGGNATVFINSYALGDVDITHGVVTVYGNAVRVA